MTSQAGARGNKAEVILGYNGCWKLSKETKTVWSRKNF